MYIYIYIYIYIHRHHAIDTAGENWHRVSYWVFRGNPFV